MDELLRDFLDESGEQLDAIGGQLARFERDPRDTRIVANIFLLIHAIKGACGFLDLPRLERLAHSAEALIARIRDGVSPSPNAVAAIVTTVARIKAILAGVARDANEPPGDDDDLIAELARSAAPPRPQRIVASPWPEAEFVPGPAPPERRLEGARVSAAAIERMTSLAAEVASIRDRLFEIADEDANPAIGEAAARLSAASADLRSTVAAARMSPADRLFAIPRRVARDAARELDKKVEIAFEGGDIELDRGLIEMLRDPLAELVRNAVAHGVETPEARRRRGKPETGVVMVAIRADGEAVTIDVSDDGGGLDFAAIRERAFTLGLGSRLGLAALSPTELAQFASAPGFHATGAGLARVRANLETSGGSIVLSSRPARGAVVRLRIAARSATTPIFVLDVGDERFALPRRRVEDILELGPEGADDREGIATPDGQAPAVPLASRLPARPSRGGAKREHRVALKVRHGPASFWIVADKVRRVADVALGPLPTPLRGLGAFSSAGVLPDGSVVLALDLAALAPDIGHAERDASQRRGATELIAFRSGGPVARALPAAAISEIAEVRAEQIEAANGARFVRLGDRRIPLIGAELRFRGDSTPAPLLVLWRGDDSLGLRVDEIVDFAGEGAEFDFRRPRPGVLGVARARGAEVEILDPIRLADPDLAATAGSRDAALVLDRDPFFQGAITEALRRNGYEARAAGEEGEALAAIAAERRYAVAFVDLDIADARNGEFARRFVEAGIERRPKLIGLAAHAGPTMQARARRAGLSSAVGRFDRASMLAVLRDALPPRESAA